MAFFKNLARGLAAIPTGGLSLMGQSERTGIGNFAGDLFTGGAISNNQAIRETNAANQGFAREQMAFQELVRFVHCSYLFAP